MKRLLSFLSVVALFFASSFSVKGQVSTTVGRNIGREVVRDVAESVVEESAQNLVKNTAKSYAKNSAEYAIIQRFAKNQLRRNLQKQMIRTGTKSFLEYSRLRLKTLGERAFAIITKSKTVGVKRSTTSVLKEKGITSTAKATERNLAKDIISQDVKKEIEYFAKKEGKEASKEITKRYSKDKSIKTLFKKWDKYNEDLVVNTSETGWTKVSYKSDKFCTAEFSPDGKIIKCNSGSIIDNAHPKGGPQNPFLNNPLPNRTYVVDNVSVFKTNAKGQTTHITSDISQLFKGVANKRGGRPQYGTVVDASGGNRTIHDAGHGVAKSLGGPNEAINITPQLKNTNRGGAWKKMENDMLNAAMEGKDVKYDLRISYAKSGVPTHYRARVMIDGKPYKQFGKHVLVFPNI